MKRVFLSIIIPAFNSAATIEKTLESIRLQEFYDMEVIVVDDGSTDGLKSFIDQYKGLAIQYFSQQNGGPSKARNLGVSRSNGEVILFLDADDNLSLGFLKICFDRLKNKPYKLGLCTASFINAQQNIVGSIQPFKKGNEFGPVLCGSYLIEKELFQQLGGFDVNLFYSENSEFFLRVKLSGLISFADVALLPGAQVNIAKIDRKSRIQKYSKKKYQSVKYFLEKHKSFFSESKVDYINFKRLEAICALHNGDIRNAKQSIKQVWQKNPYSLKSCFQYVILFFPKLAKIYYER
jgi:glycosyltransferase involved in cell wall biosynthesis